MPAGRGPADPSAKNIWCDAKDHARPRKYLEQNIFSKRGVQVELEPTPMAGRTCLAAPFPSIMQGVVASLPSGSTVTASACRLNIAPSALVAGPRSALGPVRA